MNAQAILNTQIFIGLIVYICVARWYVLPKLYSISFKAALAPLLLVSALRITGLYFLLPQLTNNLPAAFSGPAGWGDFSVGILALIGAILLRKRGNAGVFFAWLYAILGAADFMYALYLGNVYQMHNHLGAAWLPVTLFGPGLMVVVGLIWIVLLKHPNRSK